MQNPYAMHSFLRLAAPNLPTRIHEDPQLLCGIEFQGNRVKKLCSDETCEKVIIPGGDFAAEAEGIFTGGSPDQVEGHVLDGGEVGRGVIGADAAFIVTEHHVHDPMKAVLNHPVGANSRSELAGDPQQ